MIRLFDYWRSSASYRVRIGLNLAGLDYDTVSVDLVSGEQRSNEHLSRNPQGLVPVLEVDGLRLTQSLSILEYLDETRGLGLLPGTANDRAKVRAIAQSIACDIHPICNLRVAKYAVGSSHGAHSMESWMQHFIGNGLIALEEMVCDGDYCHGDAPTVADLCLVPQIYNADRWKVDWSTLPKLQRIYENLSTIPAFANAHPDVVKPHTSAGIIA